MVGADDLHGGGPLATLLAARCWLIAASSGYQPAASREQPCQIARRARTGLTPYHDEHDDTMTTMNSLVSGIVNIVPSCPS